MRCTLIIDNLDYSKDFDAVPHERLLKKLETVGVAEIFCICLVVFSVMDSEVGVM